jgi:DegV family protein with EDD domain
MNIRIVCDSTFGLSDEYIEEHQIKVAPLNVIIDGTAYKDKIEIDLETVMDSLNNGKKVSTSQPSPYLYASIFSSLKDEGATDIICFTISSTLSGTYSAANLGKADIKGVNIHVVDTLSGAMGSEMILREALNKLDEGYSLEEMLEAVENMKKVATILLCMENLNSLKLSGRINKIKATIGNLIHVKPILEYIEGKLNVLSKFRTEKAVFGYIVERIKEASGYAKSKLLVYVAHVRSEEKILLLKDKIEESVSGVKVYVSRQITPVIAVNIGYGGYGVSWCYEN